MRRVIREKKQENNVAVANGIIEGNFQYSHTLLGEGFYKVHLLVKRISGRIDKIPLIVSERIVDVTEEWDGRAVEVVGQFRSFNRRMPDGKARLELNLFVKYFVEFSEATDTNKIEITGFICMEPTYRITPSGRELCDIMVAVNRGYGKSDYIPCITWGRNARFAGRLEVGQKISLKGRIQSREYVKIYSEDEQETRTAYEVSISSLEVPKDDEQEKG